MTFTFYSYAECSTCSHKHPVIVDGRFDGTEFVVEDVENLNGMKIYPSKQTLIELAKEAERKRI